MTKRAFGCTFVRLHVPTQARMLILSAFGLAEIEP
jgi:hypothetical protein